MAKKKSILGYAIFILVAVILIFISNYSNSKNRSRYKLDLSFNGRVVRKYIDNKEHGYPIIEVTTVSDKVQKINLILEDSGFFDYVQTNDSIIKFPGSLKVIVYRNLIDTALLLR